MSTSTHIPANTSGTSRGAAPVPGFDAVTIWLIMVATMVFVMVVLGGVTRLTQSGLSMVNWHPIMGVIPPLSETEWKSAFAAYKHFPEYKDVNYGMTLAEFKNIFWMEYIHRMWGRTIGLVYALPFAWFVLRGTVRGRFAWKLGGILLLGGMQGIMGWIMVKSGLVNMPTVSPYRLTAHLALAVTIYLIVIWIVLRRTLPPRPGAVPLRRPALVAFILVLVTMAAGGFVAGTDAGMTYNTFPLMDGKLVPDGLLALHPVWRNPFENVTMVQFDHRVLAITTVCAVLVLVMASTGVNLYPRARAAVYAAFIMVLVQATLGITTLLLVVPVSLGALHQASALVLCATLLWVVFETRGEARIAT